MRLGIVRGHVVLNLSDPYLTGTRFLIVEPVTGESLAANDGTGGGKQLVVADHLGPAEGQMIAFVEGREAANPYWPGKAPVDAYCSLIVETVHYCPPIGQRADQPKPAIRTSRAEHTLPAVRHGSWAGVQRK
jgi:microcompartment protein CcmK/EutM